MAPFSREDIAFVLDLLSKSECSSVEYASEHFSLKMTKSPQKQGRPPPTEQELLKQHLEPLPAEPWNDIPQAEADAWAAHATGPGGSKQA